MQYGVERILTAMRAETPFDKREFFLKSSHPSFLIKRAALGNLKASFHCTHWHRFFPLKKEIFRIPPSPFSQREVFLKSSRPSLPLKKAPPLISVFSPQGRRGKPPLVLTFLPLRLSCKESSTSNQAFLLRRKDVTALRCSEPLRSMDGGPKRSSPCYAGWDRMGMTGYSLYPGYLLVNC